MYIDLTDAMVVGGTWQVTHFSAHACEYGPKKLN